MGFFFAITETVGKYPQESYAMVVCVIEPEWKISTCDKIHMIRVYKSGEASSGNLFDSSFLWMIEIYPTHCRNLK